MTLSGNISPNYVLKEYQDHTLCLTNGSKSKGKKAYAYCVDEQITTHRIRNSASIYSTELNATLARTSRIVQLRTGTKYVFLTDSLSSFQALSNPFSTNSIIQHIYLSLITIYTINSVPYIPTSSIPTC